MHRGGRTWWTTVAGCEVGEEVADVGWTGSQRIELVRTKKFAVLEQVSAVGVERVAGETPLQLEVGEEVED